MKRKFRIRGMHCASCSAAVERVTKKLDGVVFSSVNLTTEILDIEFDEKKVTDADIIKKIEKAGFGAEVIEKEKPKKAPKTDDDNRFRKTRNSVIFSLVLSFVLMYISMGEMMVGAPLPEIISMHTNPVNFAIVQMILSVIIIFIGRRFYIGGFKQLIRLNPNMDSLVAIGGTAAFIYSFVITLYISSDSSLVHSLYYESSAVVVSLVSLGKLLEERSKLKTKGAITRLIMLSPDIAHSVDENGKITDKKVDEITVGELLLVKPGERFPADAVIESGSCSSDESFLTGESMPVEKNIGDTVSHGSVNLDGAVYIRVKKAGKDTALQKIIAFVEESQSKKAPISKIADKVAGIFVPAVIIIAIISAVVWAVLGKDIGFVLKIFTSVLVIACPCAMGLATPTAVMVGTGLGAENGILIRGGEALEITHKAKTIVFDKTGTLTEGKPTVSSVFSLTGDEDEVIRIAATAEKVSSHPLSLAIIKKAEEKGLEIGEVKQFKNLAGKGIAADNILVGNERFLTECEIDLSAVLDSIRSVEENGETAVTVCLDNKPIGVIGISDKVKPTSKKAIEELKKRGIKTVMLTGDNKLAAKRIAEELSLDEVFAEVLPEEKANVIEKVKMGSDSPVIMVGDGVNDAPALSVADVGCAIGSGSDVAVESASIVLMKNDPEDVIRAVDLSKYTLRTIKQNLFWAFIYNSIGIPIAAGVLIPFGISLSPVFGALAMSLSSVCVVSNALRLKNKKL